MTGELINLEVSPPGVSSLAGRFADDESLRDICSEIYRERDADHATIDSECCEGAAG